METKKYLTPTEVSELLLVSPVTVRQWAQKGDLLAKSTPGGHRRFLYEDVKQFAISKGLELQAPDPAIMRILIVDDDPQFTQWLVDLFEEYGTSVVTNVCNEGFEAGIKVHTFRPDVILLDLMMTGIDGFTVCSLLKDDPTTADIKIIAITGYATEENAARIKNMGAAFCMAKPIDPQALISQLGLELDSENSLN